MPNSPTNSQARLNRTCDARVGSCCDWAGLGLAFQVGLICCVLLTFFISGCAKLKPTATTEAKARLPVARLDPDTVVLEIAVAQLSTDQAEDFEAFWNQLDSQSFELAHRKLVDQNGLRFGTISSSVPAALQRLLEPAELDPDKMNEWESQLNERGLLPKTERLVIHQRIQNRDGQSHQVPTSRVHEQASWVVQEGNRKTPGRGESVVGGFQVQSYQNGDGSVRLVLLPQVHHGQNRPRIGFGDGSFVIEAGQSVHRVEQLKTEAELFAGETLVVAPTADNVELGALLMAPTVPTKPIESAGLFRILMIRVVQTQADDLFQKQDKIERLSSVPEF